MAGLLQQVGDFVAQQALWRPGAALLLAVSGGPDSLCLLHLLCRLRRTQDLLLHVAHFDHGLRADSAGDAAYVAAIARDWDLPYTGGTGDVRGLIPAYGGVEAAARAARYGFLRDTALALGVDAVVTGHHADDQAETVIMRLLRGAGPSGLAAMRPFLPFHRWHSIGAPAASIAGVPEEQPALVRPLLRSTRGALLKYCTAHHLEPRHDVTNESSEYLRNRVRGYIIPLLKTYNANIVGALGRTAGVCADEDALLAELLDREWPALVREGEGQVCLDRQACERLHRALRRRALRKAAALLAPGTELSADHLDRMLRLVEQPHGRLQLPSGVSVRATRDLIILEQAEA